MAVEKLDGTELGTIGAPASTPNLDLDDDGKPKRTGTTRTASAHIITAVIGSGVLSLAWTMAQLGWVFGTIFMILFAIVTYYCSLLLADGYRTPDPVTGALTGPRNYTYKEVVKANLGDGPKYRFCAIIQYINLVGSCIGYTITASISMVAIGRSNCFHKEGRHAPCHISNNPYMIMFGVAEILCAQIPDLHQMWWLSIVAAVMSFSYSTIGVGLALGQTVGTVEKHHSTGTWNGAGVSGLFQDKNQTWATFQSLGNVAFAYSFSMLLVEIQDTIAAPGEIKIMKKSSTIGVFVTTAFYMLVGFLGYAAFGNNAPGNLLTGFGFYEPFWLVDIANICIVVHLVGAYQIFAQPFFAFVEEICENRWTKSSFICKKYRIGMGETAFTEVTLFKLFWRTAFVMFTTLVSMMIPFFNDVVGILGALAFFPLTVYFPTEIRIAQKKIPAWSPRWMVLKLISLISLVISVLALVGSFASVVVDLKAHYIPFKTRY